jgi:orotidine-5'-phosphate decarboxylase
VGDRYLRLVLRVAQRAADHGKEAAMTGPEHYQEAEQHLEQAKGNEPGSDMERYNLVAAQVHATLAVAAATSFPEFGEQTAEVRQL